MIADTVDAFPMRYSTTLTRGLVSMRGLGSSTRRTRNFPHAVLRVLNFSALFQLSYGIANHVLPFRPSRAVFIDNLIPLCRRKVKMIG